VPSRNRTRRVCASGRAWRAYRKSILTSGKRPKCRLSAGQGGIFLSIGSTAEKTQQKRRNKTMEFPFIDTAATGRNIDRLRQQAGLSVRDMQKVFGFATPQAIYKWIHGTALPTIDNLVILAVMLDVTMDEIIVVRVRKDMCA